MSFGAAPDHRYWLEVGSDNRMHPYGMHKTVNLQDVEVVHSITDSESHPRRYVLVRNGKHEAWVVKEYEDEYGYELRPDEMVSSPELDAITLQQRAIRDEENIPFGEVLAFANRYDDRQVLKHTVIAAYYLAKSHPDVDDEDVDYLREKVHECTNHVDTSHQPTLRRILQDFFEENDQAEDD